MGPKKTEIKASFEGREAERARTVLGLDVRDATPRRIFFSEIGVGPSAALPLAARGIILRSRRSAEGGDTTLKLRGPELCIDEAEWDRATSGWKGAKLEGDWSGDRRLVSASLKRDLDPGDGGLSDPRDAAAVAAALSADQLALARSWMIPLDRLRPWGPVLALTWSEVAVGDGSQRCDVEQWALDGALLEVSRRVRTEDAPAAQQELSISLRGLSLLASASATKTERAIRALMAM